jgi:hypothetical protein
MSEHNVNLPVEDHDDPAAGPTWFIGIVGAVLLVFTVLVVAVIYFNFDAAELEEKVINREPEQLSELRAAARVRLDDYGQHDFVVGEETEKRFHIPISEAMSLVADEYGSDS